MSSPVMPVSPGGSPHKLTPRSGSSGSRTPPLTPPPPRLSDVSTPDPTVQLVHCHNDTSIREYPFTHDLCELMDAIMDDLDEMRSIHNMTYKLPDSPDEIVIKPENWRAMMKHPNAIINVYFVMRRKVRFHPAPQIHEIFATDFDNFVEEIEREAGRQVSKIAYSVTGPSKRAIEFEVREDTFSQLPNVVFMAYFEGTRGGRTHPSLCKNVVPVQFPDDPDPILISAEEGWTGILARIASLLPQGKELLCITYVPSATTPKSPKSCRSPGFPISPMVRKANSFGLHTVEEVEVDEEIYYTIADHGSTVLFVHLKDAHAYTFIVDMGDSSPRKCQATSFAELKIGVSKMAGHVVQKMSFRSDNSQVDLTEDSFEEAAGANAVVSTKFYGEDANPADPQYPVFLPTLEVPVMITAEDFDDLVKQVETVMEELAIYGGIATMKWSTLGCAELLFNKEQWDDFVDACQGDGEEHWTCVRVFGNDPDLKLVIIPGDIQPRILRAATYASMLTQIEEMDDIAEAQATVTQILFSEEGEEGSEEYVLDEESFEAHRERSRRLTSSPLSEQDPNDKAAKIYRVVLRRIDDTCRVVLPGESIPRVFHAATYAELVGDIQADCGRKVESLEFEGFNGRAHTTVEVMEDTFEDLAPTVVLQALFREPVDIRIKSPLTGDVVRRKAAEFNDLMNALPSIIGPENAVDKALYGVSGPTGITVQFELNEISFDDVRRDPENHIIIVVLQKRYKLRVLETNREGIVQGSSYTALSQSIANFVGGRDVAKVVFGTEETVLSSETCGGLKEDSVLLATLEPKDESTWLKVNMKFPFGKGSKIIEGAEWEGVLRELGKQAPEGFGSVARVWQYQQKEGATVEVEVDEAVIEDIEDPNTEFYVWFGPAEGKSLPTRTVYIDPFTDPALARVKQENEAGGMKKLGSGQDLSDSGSSMSHEGRKLDVPLGPFDTFMESLKELSGGHYIHTLTCDLPPDEGSAESSDVLLSRVVDPITFYELPIGVALQAGLAAVRFRDGVQVRLPNVPDTIIITAHTYERFMQLVQLEADKVSQTVENITYEVDAGEGMPLVEFDDLNEEVFTEMDDLQHVIFKVYYEGCPEGLRTVYLFGQEEPKKVVADSFQEFVTETTKLLPPGVPTLGPITYEVQGPAGNTIMFPLTAEAWEDVKEDLTIVFRAEAPETTSLLGVRFPWSETPEGLPGGSYLELMDAIRDELPADLAISRVSFTVEGPSGREVLLPLTEDAFVDIEDANQSIVVETKPRRALQVQFPPAPSPWPLRFAELESDVKSRCLPHRTYQEMYIVVDGKETVVTPSVFDSGAITEETVIHVRYAD